MTSAPGMLELADVHTYYGNIRALRGISLSVAPGEIVTLIGANGAGKTTTLRTILGTVRPRRGTVRFNGQRLDTLTTDRIVRLGIAQSPEGRRIFSRMTVLENLELGAFARRDREAIAPDLERAFTLFPRLRERSAQKGGTLSGGEQQMLAIGRALMARPALLLLDEPSMGLSPILVDAIRIGERPMDGSSSKSNAGLAMRARPMASICCSPPESVPPFCAERSRKRGKSVNARSRSGAIASRSRRAKAPSSRFSSTVIREKIRRPSGDCAIPRRTMRSVVSVSRRWPLKRTVPRRGRTVPRIVRSVVVLPAPLAPMSVTISPGATDSEMPRSARMLP